MHRDGLPAFQARWVFSVQVRMVETKASWWVARLHCVLGVRGIAVERVRRVVGSVSPFSPVPYLRFNEAHANVCRVRQRKKRSAHTRMLNSLQLFVCSMHVDENDFVV